MVVLFYFITVTSEKLIPDAPLNISWPDLVIGTLETEHQESIMHLQILTKGRNLFTCEKLCF
jgi:hypothetical protein